ncbi:hypothetical protein lbkm_0145 [Lachnospiraceae bacterium KM106-2]|nr:hypothetical protein lbkm_0145 [Lachnospiraceae bacterium KM106-2]
MPYEPRTHDVISGNNFITEEKGQAFEDIKDDFEWGEELIAAANPNEREDNKQLETIWYFEDGDWKSKEVYLSEIEEKEVESLTSVGKTENDSNATTKLDLDVVGDGVTTKLDLSVSEIGCDVTTKLELDDLDEGVKPTTKLDVSEIDDGSGVTTKLDLSAIDAGSEVTTKLDLCEFGEE